MSTSTARRFDLLADAGRRAGATKLADNLLRLVARARRRPRGRVVVAVRRAVGPVPGVVEARPRASDPWEAEQFPVGGR